MNPDSVRVVIITISDRSYRGERLDLSGPALVEQIANLGWGLSGTEIVPDNKEAIKKSLTTWADGNLTDLILTTGGTGLSPRDVTPEATQDVVDRLIPGISEVMRAESVKINPHAMLSRSVAGIRNSTIIVNLPGSPKAAIENLAAISRVIPHAIQLIQNDPDAEKGHLSNPATG